MSDHDNQSGVCFSALEDKLHGDEAGEVVVAELAWIDELDARTRATMACGQSARDFAHAAALASACSAARTILKTPPARKTMR